MKTKIRWIKTFRNLFADSVFLVKIYSKEISEKKQKQYIKKALQTIKFYIHCKKLNTLQRLRLNVAIMTFQKLRKLNNCNESVLPITKQNIPMPKVKPPKEQYINTGQMVKQRFEDLTTSNNLQGIEVSKSDYKAGWVK